MSIVNVEALKSQGCELWWPGNVSSANSPKQITANGDVKQLLPFPEAGIGMFDGTGDYLIIPDSADWDLGTNVTYSAWIYPLSISAGAAKQIMCQSNGTNSTNSRSPLRLFQYNSGIQVYASLDGTNWIGGAAILDSGQGYLSIGWNHVELVKSESSFYLFINGILRASYTNSGNWVAFTGSFYIGSYLNSTDQNFYGYMSEVCVKNVALHTSNFTPPKRQLESDSNTKLLLHFNRNDTTFVDSSSSAHSITAYGDAKQLTSPCGSGVAYFDGNGDYLTVPHDSGFNLSSNDFTIEFCVRFTSISSTFQFPISKYFYTVNSDRSWTCAINNTSIYFQYSTTGANAVVANGTVAYTFATGITYRIAIQRSGSSFNIWINGSRLTNDTITNTIYSTSNALVIGATHSSSVSAYSNYIFGYVSEVRISSISRYTAGATSIAIPTQPFKPDIYTKLLLHMDGVGNAFYDSSDPPGDNGFPILPDGATITPNGTFTTVKGKDGRDYWLWPNSTNSLVVSNHTIFNFGSYDFTMLLWFKTSKTDTTNVMTFVSRNSSSGFVNTSQGSWSILTPSATPGTPCFFWAQYTNSAPTLASSKTDCNDNKWHHLAIVRNGSSFTMYIDGDSVATATTSLSFIDTATPVYIGYDAYYTPRPMIGNIKDLMIFKQALTQDQIAAIMAETYIY